MKVLVTGGAGFIGSHLCARLIREGHEVYCLDNLSTGRRRNVKHLSAQTMKFHFIQGDVRNPRDVAYAMKGADTVVHLAAGVGVMLYVENSLNIIETNVLGTHNIFERALINECKVLLASTSEVYGKSQDLPFKEGGDRVIGSAQRWSYSLSKQLDECLALGYFIEHDLSVTIMRFFNTVGPRQIGQYGMVLPRFIQRAILNQPLEVFGDGQQTRCFCNITDVLNAIMLILKTDRADGEIFNIGSSDEISIERLALKVIRTLESNSRIQKIPYEAAYGPGFEDMKRRVPDCRKMQRWFNWKPNVDLTTTILEIAHWMREDMIGENAKGILD